MTTPTITNRTPVTGTFVSLDGQTYDFKLLITSGDILVKICHDGGESPSSQNTTPSITNRTKETGTFIASDNQEYDLKTLLTNGNLSFTFSGCFGNEAFF